MLLALVLLPHMACAAEQKLVELKFPTDMSYGKLYASWSSTAFQGYMLHTEKVPFAVAKGTVELPKGYKMARLDLSYAASNHLDALKNVGPALIALTITLDNFDDDALLKIGAIPQLAYLKLSDSDITDRGLPAIGKLTHLQMLYADQCELTGAGVMKTDWPQSLILLNISFNKLGDDCMQKFVGLKNLQHLQISRTGLTDAAAKWISKNPNITALEVQDNNIGDKAMSYIATMPKLQFLDITSTHATDRSLTELQKVKTLTSLRIDRKNFSPQAIANFRKARPSCGLDELAPRINPDVFGPLH
jgi:hypothetical protein